VHRFECDDFQNEQVQSTLHEISGFAHYACISY
jgi:hypothetical protein